jgi:hypothetical protein
MRKLVFDQSNSFEYLSSDVKKMKIIHLDCVIRLQSSNTTETLPRCLRKPSVAPKLIVPPGNLECGEAET